MESGGYDVHFVEEPADYLKCVICHLALKQPVMFIECGHRVCHFCFGQMKSHASQNNDKILCPHDRIEVNQDKVVDDKGISRVVMDLRVTCSHCEWLGELRDLENHKQHECIDTRTTKKEERWKQLEESFEQLKTQKNKEIEDLKSEIKVRDYKIKSLEASLNSTKERVDALERSMRKVNINKDIRGVPGSSSTRNTYGIQVDEGENTPVTLEMLMNVDEYIPNKHTIFIWKIMDYYNLRDKGHKVYSPKFYCEPQGICCRLSIGWFGNRKGRLGVFLHVCKGIFGEKVEEDFQMEIDFAAPDMNGSTIEDTITLDEVQENLDAFTIQSGEEESQGYGLTHFLNMPALGKYVIDNILTIKCTLSCDGSKEDYEDQYSDFSNSDNIYDSDYDDYLEF